MLDTSPVDSRFTGLRRSAPFVGALFSVCVNSVALAQSADNQPLLEEVMVSATRVEREGYDAPTPTIILGAADLEQRGATNVADVLNEIPAFRASNTPTGGSLGTFLGQGQNFLDMRGLGPVRTLVLVNGRRHVTSNLTGSADLNLIPTIMIERTETVTGGASAAWGSDAVAGVVNLMLKNNLQGVQADLSYGRSQQRDANETRAAVAGGTAFADGRGHAVLGGEYVDSGDIGDYRAREWSNREYGLLTNPANATNGQPRNIIGPNMHFATQNGNGLIIGGPLANTTFSYNPATSTSTSRAFQFGQTFGASANMFGGEGYGVTNNTYQLLKSATKRYSVFGRVSYDLADGLNAWTELSTARSRNDNSNAPPRLTYLLRNDNAYLRAALSPAQLATLGTANVTVGRFNADWGAADPIITNTTNRFALGLHGRLISTWTWDAYYQIGKTDLDVQQHNNENIPNFNAALDAVNVGGAIQCRNPNLVTTTATGALVTAAPGCVPVNILGSGAPSQAALAYFMGTSWYRLKTQQQVVAANLRGEPFSTWAGVVSLAGGLEYRQEKADQDSDALSQANAWNVGNQKPLHGKYDVKEAYLETVVPFAKDLAWAKSLDLNAAARRTDYSTSGLVTTWKVGLTYRPTSQVLVRGTKSRDIRAPNMAELFTALGYANGSIIDASGQARFIPVANPGNLLLKPEEADTDTFGVTYQPEWLSGFKASVDYYRIAMTGQISTLGQQQLLNRCLAGATDLCSYITFNSLGVAGGIPTQIINSQLNLLGFETSGTDIEVSYRLKMASMGDLSVRVLGTHVDHLKTIDTAGTIDRAGQTGVGTAGQAGVAKWLLNTSLTYNKNALAVTAQVRYIAKGTYDVRLIGPDSPGYSPTLANSINDNTVPSRTYVNLSSQYDIKVGAQPVQVYGVINNLFDKDPPLIPSLNVMTNGTYFDTVGRTYRLGVRMKM